MKLIEIFNQLTYGELAQLNIGGVENGEINENNYDAILAHINLGLSALYKRFPLKEGRLTLALQPTRFTYPLTTAYAQSNTKSTEPVKYIQDTADPFDGFLHKVEQVFTSAGHELGLNDAGNEYAVATPSANVLRVPEAIVTGTGVPDYLKTSALTVVYRANHPMISQNARGFNPETYEVGLPYSHLDALLLYVASRVHTPLGGSQFYNAGDSYASRYEMACQQIEQQNLRVDQGAQYDRIQRGGWV